MPVSFLGAKSYSLFSGVQDALTQWWYGHNAVGFFLTAGFLGMMYYFVPKRAQRPVYSYRLSIIHFWSLIFLYIWAGPHHLHYTALPDWAQTLGMIFSIMLWMPSWGGMINGLMTLSGAWDKLQDRSRPAHDGPRHRLLRHVDFRRSNDVDQGGEFPVPLHRLDHRPCPFGRLGWVGMISIAAVYHLVPKLWRRRALQRRLVNWHFWLATLGIVLYASSMWVAGIMQGLMWREYDDQGFLVYSFAESVAAMHPYYYHPGCWAGCSTSLGALIMVYNLIRTVRGDIRQQIAGTLRLATSI